MANKHHNPENRLGHDPLEWLDANNESAEPSEDASGSEVSNAAKSNADENIVQKSQEQESHDQENLDNPSALSSDSNPPATLEHFVMQNQRGTYTLPQRLIVQQAERLHADFCHIVKMTSLDHLIVDASKVEDADTTGVQLLYALVQHMQKNQKHVEMRATSAQLNALLKVAGVAEFFENNAHAN